jgi:hypothetical protein
MPVVGFYHIDDDGGLNLVTDYETMSSVERFWFASPDLRLRSSTVKRFGGFSTASFCTETRIGTDDLLGESESGLGKAVEVVVAQVQTAVQSGQRGSESSLSLFGW